jgi:peptide/nickel transport system permease protein
LIYGSRFSLSVGIVAVAIALTAGVTLGATAGYYGGTLEIIIMRATDIFSAVPNMLMAIVIVSSLGANTINLMIAVGVTSIPQFVRITRAAVLTVRSQEYIEAARAIGIKESKIIFSHILPNCLSPIIVQTTLRVASAIISASSLSFLGLGVPAPAPEWGSMLSSGRRFIRDFGYMTVFPGIAIMLTVLSLNLLGDGLRDALDPKLKK